MIIQQSLWTETSDWKTPLAENLGNTANLVVCFMSPELEHPDVLLQNIRNAYPNASLVGCTTAGEIYKEGLYDKSVSLTAIAFESSHVKVASTRVEGEDDSSEGTGNKLAQKLPLEELVGVLVLSDGTSVNGSGLLRGFRQHIPNHIDLMGGLAADGSNFNETKIVVDDSLLAGHVTAVGFYGSKLHITGAAGGGWRPFGPQRVVTRAQGNVLYELDGEPALDLYKHYLGDEAADLPGTGLLFPLTVYPPGAPGKSVVRTLLAIDEEEKSMTFAGDITENWHVHLLRASIDNLVTGAEEAALLQPKETQLTFLFSCVGRRLMMGQRTEDEIEGVLDILPNDCPNAGFYSYGEIWSGDHKSANGLHNQTMTIMGLTEET